MLICSVEMQHAQCVQYQVLSGTSILTKDSISEILDAEMQQDSTDHIETGIFFPPKVYNLPKCKKIFHRGGKRWITDTSAKFLLPAPKYRGGGGRIF